MGNLRVHAARTKRDKTFVKALFKTIIVLAILGGLGYLGYTYGMEYLPIRQQREFRTVPVSRGKIVSVVTATGTIRPVVTVSVGTHVSGQVTKILVDFNDEVEEGQLLAQIDPRTYESHVARDKAALATAKADRKRVQAMLEQSQGEEARTMALRQDNPNYVSEIELDKLKYQRLSFEAQLEVADAAVEQAEALLQNSMANLEFTEIRAPVSGTVIDRKVEPGQTLASQFQVPQLFEIAQRMDEEMHIMASVDEADIGTIIEASKKGSPVRFTVDAYPGIVFEGRIIQIRSSSLSRESIVTYPTVIATKNRDGMLLPGMTATIEFETDVLEDAIRIPNSALRFLPERDIIAPEYRSQFDEFLASQRRSSSLASAAESSDDETTDLSSLDIVRRLVWKKHENFVRPVEVEIGISNASYTQVLNGNVDAGDQLVDAILTQ